MLKLAHKDLKVWKKSIELIKEVYTLTKRFPKDEMFGLSSQAKRASVSVAANIAEGASRKSANDRKRFYEISRSSLVEVDTHFEVALAVEILKSSDVKKLESEMNEVFAMMTAMINNTRP
jgi:four helix bundle protein